MGAVGAAGAVIGVAGGAAIGVAGGAAVGTAGGAAVGIAGGIGGAAGGEVGAATGGRVEVAGTACCWVAVGVAYWGIDVTGSLGAVGVGSCILGGVVAIAVD